MNRVHIGAAISRRSPRRVALWEAYRLFQQQHTPLIAAVLRLPLYMAGQFGEAVLAARLLQ